MMPSPMLTEDRWARVAWSHLVEPDQGPALGWIGAYGPVEALDRLAAGHLDAAGEYLSRLGRLDIERAVQAMRTCEVRAIVPGDEEWPRGLEQLSCPPVVLHARGEGHLGRLLDGSVAVVGARAATAYGVRVASDLGSGLAERGVTVVSGAAFGIDAAAHRGALAVDGPTVAVLARGLDAAYPLAHDRLIAQIREQGAVIGELPVGWAPYRQRFLSRNRLIAAVSVGTVVVEAGLRSGANNTATRARELHRHLAAVPGPVTSALSAGCHELVRRGASLVTDAADVMDLMGRLSLDAVERRAPQTVDAELGPEARTVWSAVPVRHPADAGDLSVRTGLGITTVLRLLGSLELDGLVVRAGDGWRKASTRSGAAS